MRISDWSSDVCSSDLLEAMNQGQLSTATGLVGKYALTSGTTAVQDSTGAVYGQIDIPAGSTDTSVAIKDSTGKTHRTISDGELEAGKHDFAWADKYDEGEAVTPGPVPRSEARRSVTEYVCTCRSRWWQYHKK